MTGTIVDRLRGKSRVYLDSNAVIYFIEKEPKYHPVVRPIFEMIGAGRITGVSSYLTLLEVLVQPFRKERYDLAKSYQETLLKSANFEMFPVDRSIAQMGATIRAQFKFRTPDAIQLATASHYGVDVFVTNDVHLRQFRRLEVLILDDMIPSTGA